MLKTATWRVVATAVTILAIYFVTENITLASTTGLGINLIKTVLYYFHERIWEKTTWGREI